MCLNFLIPNHRSLDCKSGTCSVPKCGTKHNNFLRSEFSKMETTTEGSDATTTVDTRTTPCGAYQTTEWKLQPERSGMCDTGSWIPFVDKSNVCTLHLRKASLSGAGIHGSKDVRSEIVPKNFSARTKSQPLTTVQFHFHEKLNLSNQIVDRQGLKRRYPYLRNQPNQC